MVAVKSDVSKLEDLDRLYAEVAAKKGKIDVLFANAGIVETVEPRRRRQSISTKLLTSTRAACTSRCRRRCRCSMMGLRSS